MLEKRLPVPAYDMLLKCSHAFNVLDARGAVGVTERADCFARMRALAREVTGVWGVIIACEAGDYALPIFCCTAVYAVLVALP